MNIAANTPVEDEIASFHRKIPDHRTVFVGELAQNGEWIVANISTTSFWPIISQKVRWRGVDIWIIPVMKGFYPAVAMMVPPGRSRIECEELVLRFVSTLSWVEERGYMVDGGLSGGNLPRPMGRDKDRGFSICDEFDLSYFPEVTHPEAGLALGLMREGRGLNHVGYSFLSFYRVLEVAFPDDNTRIAWIAAAVAGLSGFGVKEALAGVRAQGHVTPAQIGTHLFKSGRCAMAHGARKPIVDPDKPGDLRRLGSELPIVRDLAVKAIEEVFGVETRGTNYRKHLYELEGFKRILGPDLVDHLTRGTQAPAQTLNIPDVSLRLRRRDPYAPLECLTVTECGQNGKDFFLRFESRQGDVTVRMRLDFDAERLECSMFEDIAIRDLGTAESADRIAEMTRFQTDLLGNGQLSVVESDTGALLGRKDAYLPVNMYVDHKLADAEIARWKGKAEQRREQSRKFAQEMESNARGYDVTVAVNS